MSDSTTRGTNPAARLLNLVIALVNTAAMTKRQINASVAGYGDAPTAEAFERMFERDKDTLRDLGIPIVTVAGGGHSEDVGYRIDQDAYALRPIDLTPAEFGVLSLAAQFWQDKTLRTDISRALTKLRAAGAGESADDAVAGLAPRVRAIGEAYGPLLEAISARRAVTFRYHTAGTGQVGDRRVEPWRIVARGGGWYVLGFDRDRGASRVFRLSRVAGRVRAVGPPGAYEIPADIDVEAMVGRPARAGVARLALLPERAEALRVRGTAAGPSADGRRDLVDVPFSSVFAMTDEVVGYADAVVVLDPPALRSAVLDRLDAAAVLDRLDAAPAPDRGRVGGAGREEERHHG